MCNICIYINWEICYIKILFDNYIHIYRCNLYVLSTKMYLLKKLVSQSECVSCTLTWYWLMFIYVYNTTKHIISNHLFYSWNKISTSELEWEWLVKHVTKKTHCEYVQYYVWFLFVVLLTTRTKYMSLANCDCHNNFVDYFSNYICVCEQTRTVVTGLLVGFAHDKRNRVWIERNDVIEAT